MAQSQYQTNDVQLSPGGSQSCAFLRLDKLQPVSRNTTSVSSRTFCKQQDQGIRLSQLVWLINSTVLMFFVWRKINHFKSSLSWTLDSLVKSIYREAHQSFGGNLDKIQMNSNFFFRETFPNLMERISYFDGMVVFDRHILYDAFNNFFLQPGKKMLDRYHRSILEALY